MVEFSPEEYELLTTFGKNLQTIRINKKISIKELSNKTKIREQYLRKIEKGQAKKLATKHLFRISDALKINLSELLKGL